MSNDENQDWQWTNKGPALIIGAVLMALGGFLLVKGRWKFSIPAAVLCLAFGFSFIVYSTTVHEWCAPAGRMRWSSEFGSGFWHGPSAWDCWHLVNPSTPRGR